MSATPTSVSGSAAAYSSHYGQSVELSATPAALRFATAKPTSPRKPGVLAPKAVICGDDKGIVVGVDSAASGLGVLIAKRKASRLEDPCGRTIKRMRLDIESRGPGASTAVSRESKVEVGWSETRDVKASPSEASSAQSDNLCELLQDLFTNMYQMAEWDDGDKTADLLWQKVYDVMRDSRLPADVAVCAAMSALMDVSPALSEPGIARVVENLQKVVMFLAESGGAMSGPEVGLTKPQAQQIVQQLVKFSVPGDTYGPLKGRSELDFWARTLNTAIAESFFVSPVFAEHVGVLVKTMFETSTVAQATEDLREFIRMAGDDEKIYELNRKNANALIRAVLDCPVPGDFGTGQIAKFKVVRDAFGKEAFGDWESVLEATREAVSLSGTLSCDKQGQLQAIAIAMALDDWHEAIQEKEYVPQDPVPSMVEALIDIWPALPDTDAEVLKLRRHFALTAEAVSWRGHSGHAELFERILQGCMGDDWRRLAAVGERD